MTFNTQISGSSRLVLVLSARSASAAPSPSAPTSPMMMRAGAAFHHRKPTQAPASAADRIDRSNGLMM